MKISPKGDLLMVLLLVEAALSNLLTLRVSIPHGLLRQPPIVRLNRARKVLEWTSAP
jgi:hypothetical protein